MRKDICVSELSDWRVKVDDLHLILADAYAKRFSYVQEIAKFKDQKKSVWDIQRENFIFTQTLLKFSKNEVYFIATLIESQMNLAKLNYPQWNERKHLSKKNKELKKWLKIY